MVERKIEARVPRRLTQTERRALERMRRHIEPLQNLGMDKWDVKLAVPEAWAVLHEDFEPREKKVKLTIRVDESVAKFYRALGTGYQARMNAVLSTYAQMQIARVEISDHNWALIQKLNAEGVYHVDALDYDAEGRAFIKEEADPPPANWRE